MARPLPPYWVPEIELADADAARGRAQAGAGSNWRIGSIRPAGERLIDDGGTVVFDRFRELVGMLRRVGVPLNFGFVFFLMQHCDLAVKAPSTGADGAQVRRNGRLVWRLVRVGCRVRLSQSRMAELYGFDESHTSEQIRLMREYDIIVSWGKGWYEFNSIFCWRGEFAILSAYRSIQINRNPREIRDNGCIVVRTGDAAESDALTDHSPEG